MDSGQFQPRGTFWSKGDPQDLKLGSGSGKAWQVGLSGFCDALATAPPFIEGQSSR
jgi:hypothetical protein